MQLDVRALAEFYDSLLGAVARRILLRRLRLIWPNVEGLRLLLPVDLSPITGIGLAAAVGLLLYGGAMRILAPETLVAAIAPFWRRVRPVARGSVV